MDDLAIRLAEIEKRLLQFPQDFDAPVFHHFGPGVYIRELRVRAGHVIMGHYHKCPLLNVLVQGRVLLLNPDGTTSSMIEAPFTFVAPPGQKIAYIEQDMVWQTIFPTSELDVEKIEEEFLIKSPESVAYYDALEDHSDFSMAIEEFGYSPEQVTTLSEREEDQTEMPPGWCKTVILSSPIHGKGFFSSGGFLANDIIAPMVIGGKRTPAGRYTNHSVNPNAAWIVAPDGDIYLMALRDISGCKSGGKGEEITIDYRHGMATRHREAA